MASIDWGSVQSKPVSHWLTIAIKARNEDLFKYVLDRKDELSEEDKAQGVSCACLHGRLTMLRRLVEEHGFEVNSDAVENAHESGREDIVELLKLNA